jgi:UDP-2-acetamido-2,6-beta-L-arabino-hexul-4-ose reductase
MRVLITGANGFIGSNLLVRLKEQKQFSVECFYRENTIDDLKRMVEQSDVIFHLAGENRPSDESLFETVNLGLTQQLCKLIRRNGRKISLVFTSSVQVEQDNLYGKSKQLAEEALKLLAIDTGCRILIYRLPGVFGKWCKPNYNSVVATFCYNISHNVPIQINNKSNLLRLVYIDDVIDDFIRMIKQEECTYSFQYVKPEYSVKLGDLAKQISSFKDNQTNLTTDRVGEGLIRALYATYLSYLSPKDFVYSLPENNDERGRFVEVLKTKDSGQFSFFTAHKNVTRGEHYHHTKTEKFLVVKGSARFKFRNISTNKIIEVYTSFNIPQIVQSIPGWAHDIKNVGDDEMIVFLWANEVFNQNLPDTIAMKV